MFITSVDNQIKADKCGAIGVILKAMQTHTQITGICEKGCNAFVNITANNSKSSLIYDKKNSR